MFTVIIPWKSGDLIREESFRNLLNCLKKQESLDKVNDPLIFELIIIEQTTVELNYIAKKKIQEILPEEFAGCKYIQLLNDGAFNKSWCMNVGVKQAFHEHIIFMDAESLFGHDYIRTIKDYVLNTHELLNKIMVCWDRLICLPGRDNPITRYITPKNTLALGGIWYTNKKYFLEQLGGMCENFSAYGAEDNDIYERALLVQKNPISIIPYTIVHQYHHWSKGNPVAEALFNITRQNANEINQRLKNNNIGNPNHPTLIEIFDLPGGIV